MLDTLERVDTRVEIVIDWDEEQVPKCESAHQFSKGFCSVTAKYVAVGSCDKAAVLWCENRYKEYERVKFMRLHKTCGRLLADCWKVRAL